MNGILKNIYTHYPEAPNPKTQRQRQVLLETEFLETEFQETEFLETEYT